MAAYWKNGQPIPLTDTVIDARANSIAVSGNDVYVGGYQDVSGNATASKPVYWKNGTPSLLPVAGGNTSYVNAIALTGNNLFIIGYSTSFYSGGYTLASWVTGPGFPGPSSGAGIGSAIFIDGADVYVAGEKPGSYYSPGYYYHKAHYWKNGSDNLLDKWIPTVQALTTGIYFRH